MTLSEYTYYTDTKNHGGWNATAQAALAHELYDETATAISLHVQGAVRYSSANATGYGIEVDVGFGSTDGTGRTWVSTGAVLNYANWVGWTDGYWTLQKGHEAYQVQVFVNAWGRQWSGYGPAPENPNGGYNVTIPAKASYQVTYNANGGSGAPSAQTKWVGEALTLSSTEPTRANYIFKGWATSSSATTASYQPGGSYTGDAALALYAVWELALIPPSATLTAYRVASSSATTETPTGGYAYATLIWSVDTTKVSTNAVSAIAKTLTVDSGTAPTVTVSGTTAGTSGTCYFRWTADTGRIYTLTVTVTDTNGASTVKAITIANIKYPIYVYDQYKVKMEDLTLGTALPAASGGTGKTYGFQWQQLATWTGSTAMAISLTNYSEVMVLAQASGYLGSALIPKAALTSSDQELYLGGGFADLAPSGRDFVANIKTTQVKPVAAVKDGVDVMSATIWFVYAR